MAEALDRLLSLRMHQQDGRRSPHKPLLALLALGRLHRTGSSALTWSVAEHELADLLSEFGPTSRTGRAQSAAYPFTHLRSDGVWALSEDVPMDAVGPLRAAGLHGAFVPEVEQSLLSDPGALLATARALVTAHFPETLVSDVLLAVGLDPGEVLLDLVQVPRTRTRSAAWRAAVVQAWDRQCAFCGYDGAVGGSPVGLDAAHIRWFAYDGPDEFDNGLALCVLHHKLFDRGALGLDEELRVLVSSDYSTRTAAGRQVYDLAGGLLTPRPGTTLPATPHLAWHRREVFKGAALVA